MQKDITGPGPDTSQTIAHSLAELENINQAGKTTFIEVVNALAEIHANELYLQEGFQAFEVYLRERWNLSRAHGYRLIAVAEVAKMSPAGDRRANEHQAQ